jgi:hypothetical protein
MTRRDDDPIASTQLFRAFVNSGGRETVDGRRRRIVRLLTASAVIAVAATVLLWLLLS